MWPVILLSALVWQSASGSAPPTPAEEPVAAPNPRALRSAAERGDAESQYKLALSYIAKGGPRNDREAVRWLRAAVGQHHAAALARLGRMYAEGRGVPADPREATRLSTQAAQAGDPTGLLQLAD